MWSTTHSLSQQSLVREPLTHWTLERGDESRPCGAWELFLARLDEARVLDPLYQINETKRVWLKVAPMACNRSPHSFWNVAKPSVEHNTWPLILAAFVNSVSSTSRNPSSLSSFQPSQRFANQPHESHLPHLGIPFRRLARLVTTRL